jgi:hypothetical protein
MITVSGTHVTREFGVPNIHDIAVHLSRQCQFAGGTSEVPFWSTLMHTLAVVACIPPTPPFHQEVILYAYLHDAAEAVVNDIPRPFKTDEQRSLEREVLKRVYDSLGLPWPTYGIEYIVKAYDNAATEAAGHLLVKNYGPISGKPWDVLGYMETLEILTHPKFTLDDMFREDGFWVRRFEEGLHTALRKYRENAKKNQGLA